jgi:hypothetical protein
MGAEQGPKKAGIKRTFNKSEGGKSDRKGGRTGDAAKGSFNKGGARDNKGGNRDSKGGNNTFKKRDFKAQGKQTGAPSSGMEVVKAEEP